MDFWTPQQLTALTAGRWLVAPAEKAPLIQGFSIDSRTIAPGEVFVAVRGENHDGHDHVAAALSQGAALAIVDREPPAPVDASSPGAILLVSDTVAALGRLASAWRDELGRRCVTVIAVTGSNGKTTTRHMIHAALSASLRGTQSPKSFNNHLGVPLTLLAARADDDFVVAEVGTNHPGEIAALARILRPNIAVITNIGSAHIGMFGSKEAIAQEKASLLCFIEPGGWAVISGDQPYEKQWRERIPPGVTMLTFGHKPGCDARIEGPCTADDRGLHFTLDRGQRVDLPLLGRHNVDNALAAIAVARAMGVEDGAAAKALSAACGVEMRMQIVPIGAADEAVADGDDDDAAITLINDAYNANPDSMIAALSTLASLPLRTSSRRVAVLGDMLELGDDADYEHRHVGDMLCVLNQLPPRPPGPPADPAERARNRLARIQLAILIGASMRHAAEQLARVWPVGSFHYFPRWREDLPAAVAGLLRDGDLVLLKASRGLRFERIAAEVQRTFDHSPIDHPPRAAAVPVNER